MREGWEEIRFNREKDRKYPRNKLGIYLHLFSWFARKKGVKKNRTYTRKCLHQLMDKDAPFIK